MARTQEQRKAETRASLLAAAAELFATKGFHAVSAESVADAADRTTGALYSHFGNKEGLLFALLEEWKEQTADAVTEGIDNPADLDGLITAAYKRIIALDATAGHQWLLLEIELWLHGARDEAIGAELADRYSSIRSDFAKDLVEWAAAADHELPGPADELAGLALAMLLGGAIQHRLDPAVLTPASVVGAIRSIVGLPAAKPVRSTI